MGWGKRSTAVKIDDQKGGCNYNPDITALSIDQSPNSMNVEYYNGRWRKRSGYSHLLTIDSSSSNSGHSLIDFGASYSTHKQITHIGTSVFAVSNMSDITVSTIRTGASNVRSYNAQVKAYVVQTYQDYSVPYYWDGSLASMAVLSASAPGFKRSIEFQGFILGMNERTNKTRVYYQAADSMIDGSYSDYFTLTPAPNDDQITDPFIINGRLYVGTKYGIFRVSFVGGITVFSYQQVVNNIGVTECTAQVVVTKDYGQVAIFLGTDSRMYLFDGANVRHISESFYKTNTDTEIALELVDQTFRDNCFSVFDPLYRTYRLFITKRGEYLNRFCISVDIDTLAYYPFDSTAMSAACMCFDSAGGQFLVGLDYHGSLHRFFTNANVDDGQDNITNGRMELWTAGTSAAPDGWTLAGAGASVAQEATIKYADTYSAKITRAGTDCTLTQDLFTLTSGGCVGKTYTFRAKVYATAASRVRLFSNDGTTTTHST